MLVLKTDGECTVILESVAIGAGRQTSYLMQQSRMTGLMNEMSISVPLLKETVLMAHFCAIADDNAENGTEAEPRA